MKSAIIMALAAASSVPAFAQAPDLRTHYTLSPNMKNGALDGLVVQLRMSGDADGRTEVAMPGRDFFGVEPGVVSDIVVSGGARSGDANLLTIEHKSGAEISVRYTVRPAPQSPNGPPGGQVWIEPTRFTAAGWAVFATLPGRDDQRASFAWAGFPKDWKLASDLEISGLTQSAIGDSMLLGGPGLQVIDTGAKAARARLAIHTDKWTFQPADMASFTGKIVDAAASYWGDVPPNHIVTISPLPNSPGGRIAFGTDDAVKMWLGSAITAEVLQPYLAHEYTHAFVPLRIGKLPGEALASTLWLIEGTNDFAAYATLLHGGVWSLEKFVEEYNRILFEYGTSPMINMPLSQMGTGYAPNQNIRQLHYRRGSLMGALWNARVRVATGGRKSFRDVLRAAVTLANANPAASLIENLSKAYTQVSGLSLEEDVRSFIDRGETIRLPENALGSCATVVTEDRYPYDIGFALQAGNLIGRVDQAGPAYAAGLRDGMRFIERVSGRPGDPDSEAVLRVSDASGEKLIRYRPAGKRTVQVQRIVLKPGDAAARATCAAFVSGR